MYIAFDALRMFAIMQRNFYVGLVVAILGLAWAIIFIVSPSHSSRTVE